MTVSSVVSPRWPGLIEAYRSRLPVSDTTRVVTLQEGATPLVPAHELSRRTGCEVYLKVEGANPTGCFKDRGMTMAITKALEELFSSKIEVTRIACVKARRELGWPPRP